MKDKRGHSALAASKEMLSFEILGRLFMNKVIKSLVHRRMAHPAERVIRSSCSAEYQANKDSAGMPNSL